MLPPPSQQAVQPLRWDGLRFKALPVLEGQAPLVREAIAVDLTPGRAERAAALHGCRTCRITSRASSPETFQRSFQRRVALQFVGLVEGMLLCT